MKPCSSSCVNANRPRKDELSCVNGWRWSIASHMLVTGKDDAHAIGDCARISSICAVVPLSTTCTSWLIPSSFRLPLNYLTDALVITLLAFGCPVQAIAQADGLDERTVTPRSGDTGTRIWARWMRNALSGE